MNHHLIKWFKKYIHRFFLFFLLLISETLSAQYNLVSYPSFESGTPDCSERNLNSIVDGWGLGNGDIAFTYVKKNETYCHYLFSNNVKLPTDKYVVLFTYLNKGYIYDNTNHTAGFNYLNKELDAGRYVMRMKVVPASVSGRTTKLIQGGPPHVRVILTTWGDHWNTNDPDDNTQWEATNANRRYNATDAWINTVREFDLPDLSPKVGHLVLLSEGGIMGVDDVELFEKCPSSLSITT
jgi:hypothetical protein